MNTPTPEAEAARLDELMRRVAARDHVAFVLLHDALTPTVRREVQRFVRNPLDRDEICNDVFKSVWTHAPTYDPGRHGVLPWVATIARNRSRDALRQRRGEATEHADFADMEKTLVADDAAPDADAHAHERTHMVRRALDFLTTRRRTIVKMAFLEERSHTEIAAVTERPLGTVKATIRRALTALRERLARSGMTAADHRD
ncbi:MAG: RNA polymerase sigma factor [Burkholderiales bacterium]|nr:RNA polymerase sigma factor [Burkholderiales bacterium]